MAGPPAKKPRTDNNEALGRIQDHDSLVEDDSGEDSLTVTAVARQSGLDDDDGSGSGSSSDNDDKRPATPSDSGIEVIPQPALAAPVTGKRKRQKKPKKSKAVIDSLQDDNDEDALDKKVLTYLLTIFSAIEVSKAVSKCRPESDELELSSTEPWDTFKAQVLAKISKNLAPRFLDFNNYKIMYFIPRLVPKPGRQLTSADNYTSLLKLLEKQSKTIPAINVVIEQKTTDKDKENMLDSAENNTTKGHSSGKKKKDLILPGNENHAKNVAALQEQWKCINRRPGCIGAYCYVNDTGDHLPLNHARLECWASAMLKDDGSATLEKPPNHHLFDPEPARVSPVLQHRLDAQNVKATVPTSSSALEGTIDIIRALMVQCPAPDAPARVTEAPSASIQSSSATLVNPLFDIGADMSIAQFCDNYGLQPAVLKKLDENGYDYARNLRFITLDNLTEMGFKLGEKAALQDAVERWAVRRA